MKEKFSKVLTKIQEADGILIAQAMVSPSRKVTISLQKIQPF